MTDSSTGSASPLEEQLREDIRIAQRQRDQVRLDTLRMALNGFHLEEVARTDKDHPQFRKPLSEPDRLAIIDKQVRQREEAIALYQKAGRTELADKELREATILSGYLPKPLTDDELVAVVAAIIQREGTEFRKVMPIAARETRGRADGRRVQQVVKDLTTQPGS